MSTIKAFVFDAYGTLLQVNTIDTLLESFYGKEAATISKLWRSKQLEYTWLREIMGTYKPFSEVTQEALQYALSRFKLPAEQSKVDQLMKGYDQLKIYPEAGECLHRLIGDYKLAVLSNANLKMLEAALTYNQVYSTFDQILSTDQVHCYKPNPKIYQLAVDFLALEKEEIAFITANAWDAAGAKSFGLQVYWINRKEWPVEALGVEPDRIVRSLAEIKVDSESL